MVEPGIAGETMSELRMKFEASRMVPSVRIELTTRLRQGSAEASASLFSLESERLSESKTGLRSPSASQNQVHFHNYAMTLCHPSGAECQNRTDDASLFRAALYH